MIVVLPWMLLGLLPWGLVAWHLWRGRGREVRVSYVALWPKRSAVTPRRRRPPPWPVVALLLSSLLMILAAADPHLTAGGRSRVEAVVFVDRGPAGGATADDTGLPRHQAALREVAGVLDGRGVRAVWRVGDVVVVDALDAEAVAHALPPPTFGDDGRTAADARSAAYSRPSRPVLFVGAGDLADASTAGNLVRVDPVGTVRNVGIVSFDADGDGWTAALRSTGPMQVPWTLTGGGREGTAGLAAGVADVDGEATLWGRWPAAAPDVAVLRLEVDDGWPADDAAGVARETSWPAVEAGPELPPAVVGFVDVFTRTRPPRTWGPTVRVGIDADADVVVLPPDTPAEGPWRVRPGWADGIHWEALDVIAAGRDGPGWRPIVRRGDAVLVAERSTPGGVQVRLTFEADGWEQSPDFVVFWADLLQYVGGRQAWQSNVAAAGSTVDLPVITWDAGPRGSVASAAAWNKPRTADPSAAADVLLGFRRGMPLAPRLVSAAGLAGSAGVIGLLAGLRRPAATGTHRPPP